MLSLEQAPGSPRGCACPALEFLLQKVQWVPGTYVSNTFPGAVDGAADPNHLSWQKAQGLETQKRPASSQLRDLEQGVGLPELSVLFCKRGFLERMYKTEQSASGKRDLSPLAHACLS